MVEKYSRAQRRHDRLRVQRKRRNHWGYGLYHWRHKEMPKEVAGMVANTPTPCSCEMCRNPRRCDWNKKERLTMQERKLVPVDLLVQEWYNTPEIEENHMDEREIAKYAALVATGVLTEDALLEAIGDDGIVSQIMAVAGASAVMGVASGIVEDVVDTTFDVIDDLNPFSGW